MAFQLGRTGLWTAHELRRLRTLAEQGLGPGVIAERLGRNVISVRRKALAEGIQFASLHSSAPADNRQPVSSSAYSGSQPRDVTFDWVRRGPRTAKTRRKMRDEPDPARAASGLAQPTR